MDGEVSTTLLYELSRFVKSSTGLYFPEEKWRDLQRNIQAAARDLGFTDTETCIRWLLANPLTKQQRNIIVGHLTVGETFFFRDRAVFDALRDHILIPLALKRNAPERHLRIWSAACCTGEEPYSIAILIDEMAGMFKGWRITILGTDINTRFLEKAEKGIYTRWSFRDMPERLISRYFAKAGKNHYEIAPHIRRMVSFSQFNLIEEGPVSLPSGTDRADVIFCRNVLMYLSPDIRSRITHRLVQTLAPNGWLIVSPSEIPLIQLPELHLVRFSGAILHRKAPAHDGHCITGLASPHLKPTRHPQGEAAALLTPTPSAPALAQKERPPSCPPLTRPNGSGNGGNSVYQEVLGLFEKGRYRDVVDRLDGYVSDHADSADSPHLSEMTALLAKACANLGMLEDARKWGERAVSIDRLNPDHYFLLATIYQEIGLFEEAAMCLRRVIYLDPNWIMAHFMLGHLMRREGKEKESDRAFAAAFDLVSSMDPDEEVPYSEGVKAGRLRETIRLMTGRE